MRSLTKLVRWLFAVPALIVVLLMGAIVVDGLNDDVQRSDVAVVLGSMVMPDGTPSARLRARLDMAVALYREGMFARVIVSGGIGVEGVNEALVMRDYLVSKQVPVAAILVDENGVNTRATAQHSAQLMQQHGLHSALVITQYFHITRTRAALRAAGIATVYTAHAAFFEPRDLYSLCREAFALPNYWVESLAS